MITTSLPYYRYFITVPRHVQLSHELHSCVQGLSTTSHQSHRIPREREGEDENNEAYSVPLRQITHPSVDNIHNRFNPSSSIQEIDIADIDSFSD